MNFTYGLSEEEALLVHIAAALRREDPRALLKNVGVAGAENIISSHIESADNLYNFRKKLLDVYQLFHNSHSSQLQIELQSEQNKTKEYKDKIDVLEYKNKNSYKKMAICFILGVVAGSVFVSLVF